ncbi:AHH domain-containing protein [Flavobacterium oreochromis]|uniref:AHH domain-containing protein n=2 Tax=Flavobacterium TaxID=237 RepID=A0ABW8P4V9_9FLAO|nr:AHH domain-containing protein [Flavobacterium oreochromis]
MGILALLVHNAGKCLSELKNFNWGAYLKKLIGPPPKWMINPHAHHIVFKKGRGAMVKYLDKSKAILEKHGIDWLKGKENLVWAPNKNHSTKAAKYVSEALEKADKLGGKESVIKELENLGKSFADDTINTLF